MHASNMASQQKSLRLAVLLSITLLIFVFALAPHPIDNQVAANGSTELSALAAEQPDSAVRVLIQKNDPQADVAGLVSQMGGMVIHELSIINAVVAQVEAATAVSLAQNPAVAAVSLDSRKLSSASTTYTVRDDFNEQVYNNNNGTVDWVSDWNEDGENTNPLSGDFWVRSDGTLEIKEDNNSIRRPADLSGVATAVLSLDYRRYSMYKTDFVALEISANGGASWTELDRFVGPATSDPEFISVSYDILPFATADTIIRLATYDNMGRNDYLFVDFIQIEFTVGAPSDNLLRDDFNTAVYSNNDGTIQWASDWNEDGERTNATAGDIQILDDGTLLLKNYHNSIRRSVDLSGVETAVLSLGYRRHSMTSSNNVTLEISDDGGSSWAELDRFAGPADYDSDFISASYDITPYATVDTYIRFSTNGNMGYNDYLYIDFVQISLLLDDTGTTNPTINHYLETVNVPSVWNQGFQGKGIAVAVIDSGISPSLDFGDRLLAQLSFNADAKSANDSYGHGTHVAGIIGGDGTTSDGFYQGIAPQVNLIGLKVSDESGMAYETDTVAAMQWILENKDVYNIRVVNISLNSISEESYHTSAFDLASELLWFNGIIVVASAGNRSVDGNFYTITAAPANDPFIITVGASDESDSANIDDDYIALFSAHGTTVDGYVKPDIIAPGRNIVSVLSDHSSWSQDHPDRLEYDDEYFRLSGTSMAAPIVSGAAALLLQAEPDLTPDQVKYRLMNASNTIVPIWFDAIFDKSVYPYLDVATAVASNSTESANQDVMPHMTLAKMALIAYWANQNGGETIDWSNIDWSSVNWDNVDWDNVDWASVNWGSVNWGSVNWGSVNWGSVNWGSVNWGSVNWGSVNWGSVNWGSVNWGSVNWGSASWE